MEGHLHTKTYSKKRIDIEFRKRKKRAKSIYIKYSRQKRKKHEQFRNREGGMDYDKTKIDKKKKETDPFVKTFKRKLIKLNGGFIFCISGVQWTWLSNAF